MSKEQRCKNSIIIINEKKKCIQNIFLYVYSVARVTIESNWIYIDVYIVVLNTLNQNAIDSNLATVNVNTSIFI